MTEPPTPLVTKSYVPWPAVEHVLTTQRTAIEAIYASLPCSARTVHTPKLLELLSGSKWEETILSSKLFKLYAAVVFMACADEDGHHRGDAFDDVIKTLKEGQVRAFERFNDEEKEGAEDVFMLQYLNCYEYAIIKYLHLCKPHHLPADHTVTHCILAMGPETIKQCRFEDLITTKFATHQPKIADDARTDEAELAAQLAEALDFSGAKDLISYDNNNSKHDETCHAT